MCIRDRHLIVLTLGRADELVVAVLSGRDQFVVPALSRRHQVVVLTLAAAKLPIPTAFVTRMVG